MDAAAMSLDSYTARCQGRVVRAVGGGCLARECTNCLRRTDVPANVKSVPWMQPPQIFWWWMPCPSHIAPDEPEVVLP